MSDTRPPQYVVDGRVVDDPLRLYPVPGGMAEPVPVECGNGHRFGPNLVTVGWVACVAPGRTGHRTHRCSECGDEVLTPPPDTHCTCDDPGERWVKPSR